MTTNPAARKAQDIDLYAKAAKAARARLRREFRKVVKVYGHDWPEGWQTMPDFQEFISASRAKDSTLAELQSVRDLPLSYYGG